MIHPDIFKDKHLFFGLDDDQLLKVAAVAEQQVCNEGDIICREGEMGDSMYIVVAGQVDVYKGDSGGEEVRITSLSAGALFGEMTLINVEPRSATVRAASETVLVILKNRALSEIFNEDRELFIVVLMNITRILSKRLRKANEDLMQQRQRLTFRPGLPQKSFLLFAGQRKGSKRKAAQKLGLWLPSFSSRLRRVHKLASLRHHVPFSRSQLLHSAAF